MGAAFQKATGEFVTGKWPVRHGPGVYQKWSCPGLVDSEILAAIADNSTGLAIRSERVTFLANWFGPRATSRYRQRQQRYGLDWVCFLGTDVVWQVMKRTLVFDGKPPGAC